MPIKKYMLNVDGKDHQVSEKNIEKYGIESYAKNYPGATIRMRDDKDSDYDIPINDYQRAVDSGLKPFVTSYYKDEEEEITDRSTFKPDSVVYMNQTSQPGKLDITQGKGSQSVPETIKTGTDSTTNVPEMNEMGTQVAIKGADTPEKASEKVPNTPAVNDSLLDSWEQRMKREDFIPVQKAEPVVKVQNTSEKVSEKVPETPVTEWEKPATYQDYMNELVSEWGGTPNAYPETRSEQMLREASANASTADKIWNGELKGVVDGLIEQGREEGRAKMREYQKTVYGNGGIFAGAAGMGDQSHKEYAKATDAKKVIEGVQQYLAEKNGTQTGGEGGSTNPLQEQLMQKVYDYLVQKNTPKSTAEYIMRNVFSGSILGQLMSMGDGKSYEQRQIETGGLQQYQPSAGEEIGAMAASVATDLPVMAVTGAVGGVAGNALLNGATKRLMASGLSEAAARAIATRAAQQTGMKWALRTASEAVNFGTLEGLGSMVGQAYQTGDVDLGKAATAMAKGAATGAVMGVFGVSNDKFRGMMEGGLGETAGRALGYTTSLGGRTAILTGSSVFGQYLEDPNFDINNVDWTKEIAHAGLMNLGFDILGAVKRYQAYRKTGIRMRDIEKLNLSKEDIAQLNKAGIGGKDAQEIAESILQVKDAKELKRDAPEGKGIVPSDFGFASQELGLSKEGSVLGQLLSNENIDLVTKAKVAYLMTGMQFRLAPNTNVSDVQEQADGSFTVEKFNPSGQTNETRRFKTRQEAEKYRHDMQNEVMPNQVNVLEGMMDNAGKMNTATRIFDMVAKMYNTGKEQIAEAYAKGKRGEELTGREAQAFKTIDDLLNSIQSSEDYQYSTRQLKTRMDEAYGQKTGWMDNVLKKKYNSLNETERRAYDEYISNMKSILQGNQRERLQIGGEGEPTVSEAGITPLLENQTEEAAMQMESGNAPVLPGSTSSASAVSVSSESAPSTARMAARETGAALYTEHDPAKMRQAVVRQQVARERLRNSGMLDEAIDAIGEADDANREALMSNLDNEQRRLAEDYLQQNDVVDGMNEALTMAHLPEAKAAETLAQNMVSPHGKVVVVALGKNEDPTHKYGVVVSGIDATGNLVSPEGQIIVAPLEASDIANIDFSSFDDSKAISMRMEDAWGDVSQLEAEYVMDSMLSAAQEDENILEGQTPIVPGQTLLLADTEGNTVGAQVVGGSRESGWMVMEEGTNEPAAITEEELREMMLNAERIPIMQEYEAADKAYEREQREIQRQEERAAQKARETEEAARIAEEMKKPINRLAKYPEGHKNAGKPDYENSQPEDVRAYLVESLGLEGAVKSIRNMRNSLEGQVAEQTAKIETIRAEMEGSEFLPNEAIAARELIAGEEVKLKEAQRKLDFWKGVERITAGPTQEEAQAAVTRSEAQRKAAKTKREVYKPSDEYRKMQKEISDSETALSVLNDLEPHTPEELAAQLISGGVRLMKADEQVGDTTLKGVMSMTGYGQADLQRLNFVFATRANGGVSVSEFGEMLEQAAKDAGIRFSGKTQEEGANALLSLLGDVETMGDINRYVERNRMREAQKLYDEEQKHFEEILEKVAWNEYGMSYADYIKLQDAITSIVEIRAGFTQDFLKSETYNDFISNFAANIADNGQEGNDNAGSPSGIAEVGNNVSDGNGSLVEGNQEPAASVRSVTALAEAGQPDTQGRREGALDRAADGNSGNVPVSSGQGTGSDDDRTGVSIEQIEQAKKLANEAVEEVKKEIQGRPVTVVGSLDDLSLYKERTSENIFDKIKDGFNEPGSLASYVYEVDEIFVWANKAAKYGAGKQAMKAAVYHENIHSLIRGDRYTEEEFKSFANQIREAFPDIDDYVERAYASFPQSIKNEEVVTRYVEDLVDSRLEGLMLAGEGRIEGDTDAIGEELNHVINLLKDRKYERQGRNGRGQTLSVADRSENGQTAYLLQEDVSSEKQESVHSMEEQGTVGTGEGVGMAGRKELYGSVPGNGSAGEGSEGFQVEKRHHAKLDQDVWAVKFTERFDRDKFLNLKKEVKKFRGYYSSYGKGGFIFEDEAHARKFAESVLGVEAPAASAIEQARAEVNTDPTEAQKEAGNYKMGHLKLDGYDITIENPKGSVRSGKDANGKEWRTTMNNDYGYIRGTKAVDGDHIDVFLSDKPEEGRVFVVDQTNQDGSFDESKVMYGFNSLEEAREAYLSNYDAGWESRIMAITEVSKEEFKKWIDSSTRKTKAFSEYKSVKPEEKPDFDFDSIKELKDASRTVQKVVKESSIRAYNNALVKIPVAQFGVAEEDVIRMTYDKFLEEFRAIEPYFVKKAEPYLPAVYEYIHNRLGVLSKARLEKLNKKATMPKEGDFLKNNIAGGDAVAVVRGVNDEGYLVAYAPGMEEAESGFFMGEHIVPHAEMEKIMQEGGYTPIERKEKPKEYHGGDLVYSTKHGENKHILMAHRGNGEVKYMFTDGTSALANEVKDARPDVKTNELKPTYDEQGRETIESQAGHSRGEAERLASEAESGSLEAALAAGRGSGTSGNRPVESAGGSRKPESVNGFRIGEKVLYKGKEATIYEFENNGTPVLDTGMAPVIYEVGYWDNIEKLPTTVEQINSIAEAAKPSKKLERAERTRKKNQAKREKQKEQMVDLFSQVDAMEEKLVRQEQEIDAQLALLSEYKAGPKAQVREDMHTGAAKTLEKAGRKFAKALAARLGGHVDGKDISHGITSIAPIGGDMVFRVWLDDADTQGVMMLINFDAAPDTKDFDKLVPKYGFWRMISDKDRSGVRNSNNNFYIENMSELESGSLMSRIADDMLSALNREAVKASNVATEKRLKTTVERPETTEVLTNKKEKDGRNQGTDPGMGTEARQEAERTEPGRDDRGLHGNNVPDTQGSGRVSERDGEQQPSVNEPSPVAASVKRNTHNWSYGETHLELPTGEIGKLKGNIEAIRTLKELEASGQPATPEQKQALLKFVGWGGLAEALNSAEYAAWQSRVKNGRQFGWGESLLTTAWSKKWGKHYEDLRPLMTDEEWAAAQASTLNSHYTPETVIRGLWEALEYMGFKGGSIQEPAMGVGHILGFMPKTISERSMLSGFELDSIPGRIAKQLYPDADITVAGYETQFRPSSKDAIVTNVPFGQTAPVDPALDKALRKKLGSSYNLHNYFIIKGLLELRPGGVGAFITSAATMDGRNTKAREYITSLGVDLVGAIRLPNSTFKANAGTEVTADMLFFRKRLPGEAGNSIAFTSLTQVGTGKNKVQDKKGNDMLVDVPLLVNEYFAERPEMMLGEVMTAHDAGSGGLYGGDNLTLVARPGTELAAELADAIGRLPENVFEKGTVSGKPTVPGESTTQKDGTLSVKDGKVYVASKGELSEIASGTFKHNGKARSYADATKDYQTLKETLKELIQAEQSQTEDPVDLRKQLNKQYDQFVEKYGRLNENKNLNVVMEEDPERFLPQALEKVETVTNPTTGRRTKVISKGDGILAKRVSQPMTEPTTAENLGDAIGISQAYRGRMDVGYIADMLGITTDEARERILAEREAYEDPVTGDLVDRDAYLSGNIREKLETARAAAEKDSRYEQNVTDLEKSMPESIPFVDIFYKMGTPWIPEDVYEDFGRDVCGIENMQISYAPVIDQFVVNKGYISDFTKAGNFATTRRNAMQLFEDAINLRKPVIMKTVTDSHGKEIQVRDEQATQEAIQAVMDMNDAFIQYIQEAKPLHARLTSIYNDRYNNYRLREYREPSFKGADGKVHYPNANPALTLRKHQVKAVQRSLQGSTLLAHQVGTGKTFTMITTAMEMRRLGLAKKPMIVVQNATLQDFASDFMKLYPSAKILVPNETERSASQRKRLFNLIATGDFDAIIVPQSFLAFIPDDEGRKKALIMARVDEIMAAADALQYTDKQLANKLKREAEALELSLSGEEKASKKGGKRVKDQAKKQESALVRETQKLDRRTDDVLTFEQMGVDALFIDEAHNYKKIGFTTKMQNVKGVDTGYSERANSLYLKVSYVQEKNGGRNVILATGTPITNTMAEVWTMMRFVAPEILQDYGIRTFDEFAATFGQVEPSLEQNSTGGFKIADRFKSYVNVPELVKAFRSHADVVLTTDVEEFKESKNIPKLKDGRMTNHVIQKSDKLQDVMDVLIAALKEDEKKSGKEKTPGLPLVVFSKAKQAAIDLRLINPEYADDPDSKTNRVVSEVMRIYKESTPDKGIQMIFCDSYQSPASAPAIDLFDYDPSVPQFNLYRDIKNKLIEAGIPKEEIVIVSEITNADRKKAVFEKARAGAVRVLIGSTEKMGVGVNVQERMIALHHMDAPIRPMDFEQRNGRILRQGNMFAAMDKPVEVLTYGVEGTLDATGYERLRIKQDFINQMMKGDVSGRVMEESDDEDPSGKTFSQMAAELSGDKTLQLLFIAENKVKKLEGLRRSHEMKREQARVEAAMLKTDIVRLKNKLKDAEKVGEQVAKRFPEGVTKLTINGRPVTEKLSKVLAETLEDYEGRYALNRSVVFPVIELNDKAAKMVFGHTLGQLQYSLFMDKFQLVDEKPVNTYAGVWLSLNSALANSGKRAEEIRQAIANSEARIKGAESIQEKEFDKMDELKERRQEVKELKAELAKKAENAPTPAGDVKLAKKNLKSGEKPVSLPEEMAGDSEESLDRMEQAMKPFEEVAVNAPEMVIAQSGSDILASMPRVEPLQFAKVVTEANRPEVQAMYVPWTKQIIMLPKHGTVKEMRDKRWHESFHFALDMVLPQGDAGRLMLERAAGEVNKLAPSLSKWVEETYGNRNTSEEKLVHMLEEVLSYMEDAGKVKSIRGGLDFGSQYPVLNEISNKVINYLTNNGHGKETDNYSGYDEGSEPTYRGEDQEGRNEEDFAGVRGISSEGREEVNESRSKVEPQDLTTTIVSTLSDGTKLRQSIEETKENLENLAKAYTGIKKSRGFIKDLNTALGNSESGSQSHYFDISFPDGHSIVLRTSNHNAHADTFDVGSDAISVIIKSARRKNTFQGSESVNLVEYVYFKEDIQNSDGNILSQIAESIKELIDTGVFIDKSGMARVNPDSVAASQVHSEESASLQNQGEIAKVLQNILSENISEQENAEFKFALRGYHGSASDFESFDMSKIGSGQGRKLFGYGIYVSNHKGVAQKVAESIDGRYIYHIEIPDDTGNNYLNWEKDYNAKEVLSRLNLTEDFLPERFRGKKLPGAYLYQWLSVNYGDKEAAKMLRDAGYVGIKYSVENDLGYEGTLVGKALGAIGKKSYAIFDEKDIKITDKELRFALRGKPRRKAGESLIAYNRRLKEWQQEVEEAKKRRDVENMDVENPLDTELNDLVMEMMKHPTPIRKPGENDADFNARQQEWIEWYNNRRPEIQRRMAEIKMQLENEKAAARSKEMKRTEEPLYTGEVPPQKDDEGQLSDEEMREVREIFQEKLADMRISVDKDQIKRDIKQEIIERRRYIETSNLEDTFFVDKVKKVAGSKEVLKAIPDYIEGTYTGEVSTELVEAAKLVSDWFEEAYNLMAMEGVLYDAPQIQNYVTHIWDWKRTPKEAQERYANWVNTMRLRSPFTKHRVIPSYKEGIAMGMVPKYDDITGILLEYGHYATETIANKRMIEFLRNFKVMVPGGKDNLPMEMDIIVPDKVKDPMYSRMSHTALDGYKVLTQIKPMITPVFGDQRIIDPSHLTPLANKLIDGIWATSGLMKKIALSFSFFHHGALTETAIAMLGPARAGKVIAKNLIWDVITKGNIPALNDKEAARDAVKHLVSLGASNDYVTADVNNLTTSLHRFLKDKNVHVAKEAAYILDFLNKGSDKFLWDTIHDGFKIASFAKMAKEIRAKAEREGWSQEELEKSLDEAGHLINDTFGGLHFDILGFSPKSVRMMRALLLSPDWTLATIRQALSPLGFGKLYGDEGFWKTIAGGEKPAQMRKKYGRAFWATAAIFFYALMNGLNAYFRAADEDEEKKKADEMRKVDPSYKSPYELAYPNGMKWYDYTMLGNTLGHQTHLFTGRYEDGTETYARWGKQFRELPELFFGRDGFSFPGPMIDKMSGKVNPVLATTFEFISGHSLSGWENAQMKDKKGWERDAARLHMLAMKFVPYSMPTQEDKEWYWLDLIMPSSKGFSSGKAIGYFEKGIKSGDMDYIAAVYNACVMNGVNPEQSFKVAKARIEAETKRETLEGVETVQDAMRMFDEATDVKERKRLLRYIEQQTGAQDYQAISQEEMVQQAKDVINGNDVKVEASDYYLEHATGEDVMQDYRMKKTQAGLKKYHQDYTELMMENPAAGQRMLKEKHKYIEGYVMTSKYRKAINKVKKAMKDGRIEANKGMEEIRKIRREYFENLDKLEVK